MKTVLSTLALSVSVVLSASASEEDIERVVTTASRTDTLLQSLPFSLSVVTSQSLDKIAPVHIEEALRLVAGANFHRGNGQEYLPALRSGVLSGAGACGGILTLENGIPLRAPGFCNINELFEAHTEMAQQIEVLKGPGSAHYGSNAIHGVVNVITPAPDLETAFLGVDLGSFGYKRAKWQDSFAYNEQQLGVSISSTRDSGYRNEESVDLDKLTLRHQGQFGNWDVENGLTWMRLDQETASFIEGFEAYKDRQLAQTNDDPEAFRDARALRLYSRWRKTLSNGDEWIMTPYLRDQSMTFRMHFLPGTPFEFNEQNGTGIQTQYIANINESWRIRGGIDADFTEGQLAQTQFSPTVGSPFLQATVPNGRHYDYVVDAMVLAPYMQVEWQFESGSVQFGVRTEYTEYDYDNRMLSGRTRDDGTECGFGGCRYNRPASRTDSFTATSPKLGATYQFTDSVQGFANIAAGYRAPQATELYRLQRQQQVADLDTEQVDSIEAGIRYSNDVLQLQLATYAMRKDNVIFRDSDFFNVSGGETRHKGVELESSVQISPTVSASIATAYAIHEYANDRMSGGMNIRNNAIDSAPRWVGNAQLNWQVSENFATNLELHWVGSYFTNPENLNRYEGHEIVNWRTAWQVNNTTELAFRVLNVFDETYAERADWTVFSGDRYFPGRPRSYWMSLRWNY